MEKFVYVLTLGSGNTNFEGIPAFGFAPGQNDPGRKDFRAQSTQDVQDMVYQCAGAQGMTIAVPYPEVAKYFQPKTKYDSLTLFPNDKPDDQYNTTKTFTFETVVVGGNSPMPFGAFKVTDKEMKWIYAYGTAHLKNKAGNDTPSVTSMFVPFAVTLYLGQLK